MYIKSLSVLNFRNHRETNVQLSPGINVFVGQNAQGKTNLLEAIYLTCVGRGFRTPKSSEMINFESDSSLVKTNAIKKCGEIEIEINLNKVGKKSITINKIPIKKMGELMGQVNCVFFSPDELKLIKEAPADRRRFMDISISQIDKRYFYALLRYNKILAQRNTLLKSNEDIKRTLDIWDEQLTTQGTYIIQKRIEFLDRIKPIAEKIHNFISNSTEKLELNYESNIEKDFLKELKEKRNKDMKLRTTTVGPHRDDIYISINNNDVRKFASQGQQRTVALSLKLAELEVFENLTDETPVLLLDDVFSELDNNRQSRLLESIKHCQCIITTAVDINALDAKIFKVKNGVIIS